MRKKVLESMRSDHNLKLFTLRNQMSQNLGASDLVRDRFLANICHELRTPINGVIGMLALLLDTELNSDQHMYTSTAQSSAEHLLTLIEELLDLSLLESGTLSLQEAPFDLREELATLAKAHTDTAMQHACKLHLACSIPEDARVVGDAVRLKQLVSSLLDSTVKRNPQIDIDLSIDATVETDGTWRLKLVLSNPAGPLHCDADGLSWRFTQSLAEHLGTRVEPDDGYGYASLTLMLDFPAAPDTETDTAASPGDAHSSPKAFTNYRVLVADDHVVNQQIAARMLARFGCEVGIAADGREALMMHEARPYDLILMDCQMPVIDGYQATARIRAMETGSIRTPVIGWTAFALQEERQRCLGAGMDDFMAKPLRPRPLHDMLNKWLPDTTVGAVGNGQEFGQELPEDEFESMRDVFGPDFADLAVLFMHDSPKRIDTLRAAMTQGDAALAAKYAHAFAGSTAAVGANGLSTLCRSLEANARAGALDDAMAALTAIDTEFARVRARLNSMIGRSTP
jgi:CheY-like chemotaxis protein/HPt (histidine-containing phosphotransfer) domain-containing protein